MTLMSCDLPQDELAELEGPRVKVSLIQFVTVPFLRRAVIISIVLHLSQQLGGINGVRTVLLFVVTITSILYSVTTNNHYQYRFCHYGDPLPFILLFCHRDDPYLISTFSIVCCCDDPVPFLGSCRSCTTVMTSSRQWVCSMLT